MDLINYSDREINKYNSLNIIQLNRQTTKEPLVLQQLTNILWEIMALFNIYRYNIIWKCDLFIHQIFLKYFII